MTSAAGFTGRMARELSALSSKHGLRRMHDRDMGRVEPRRPRISRRRQGKRLGGQVGAGGGGQAQKRGLYESRELGVS